MGLFIYFLRFVHTIRFSVILKVFYNFMSIIYVKIKNSNNNNN